MMSRKELRKSVGFYEVVTPTYTHIKSNIPVYRKINPMDTNCSPTSMSSPKDSSKIVDFELKDQHKEDKKKYLTAKYGSHQMNLIKKRLGVEMWIFDELRKLYNCQSDDHDCELELEEVLNLDTDLERREYALEQLKDVQQSPDVVDNFIEELLKRAKTL